MLLGKSVDYMVHTSSASWMSFLVFKNAPCSSKFVFLLIKLFIMYFLCFTFSFSTVYCTVRWTRTIRYLSSGAMHLCGWVGGEFLQQVHSDWIFDFLLRRAFSTLISWTFSPFPGSLCIRTLILVRRQFPENLRGPFSIACWCYFWNRCSTLVCHLYIFTESECLCSFSSSSRKDTVFLYSSLKRAEESIFLILLFFELETKESKN